MSGFRRLARMPLGKAPIVFAVILGAGRLSSSPSGRCSCWNAATSRG